MFSFLTKAIFLGKTMIPYLLFILTFSYSLSAHEPIDVVIPCHEKDLLTLNLSIEGIRANGKNIRRIIVVSEKPLTDKAEWFDEANYPFTKKDILPIIFNHNKKEINAYLTKPGRGGNRTGWIYQQLLKLYAPFVIPNISSNILIVDADTIFLNEVTFIDDEGNALYATRNECTKHYFDHGQRLLPDFKRVFPDYSGITHHMLFQKKHIEELFTQIQKLHGMEPWKALCACIKKETLFAGLSEYELYFNFVFSNPKNKVKIRPLKTHKFKFDRKIIKYSKENKYHYVSCHSYL